MLFRSVVPYLPPESTGEEPTVAVDPVMYPVDKVMEVTSEGDPSATTEGSATDETAATDDGTVKEDVGTTEDPGATDGSGATDDSGATDGSGDTAGSDGGDGTVGPIKYDDTQIYTTTDTGPTRGTDGCMECRNLTGVPGGSAAEAAPAPEVTADVLDGNATGVDVMDPADAKKRK